MTLNGLFFANDLLRLQNAETFLGGDVDIVGAHTGRASWTDWTGSIDWMILQVKSIDAPIRWSIPLFANGGTLAQGAAHAYDSYYVAAAKKLLAASGTQSEIMVRMGEEFNANWMPWAAPGKEADFIKTYQNFVDAFRSVSNKFKFEWNVNIGGTMDPAKAYPGDAYVDYIGMDFYWDSTQSWSIKDPTQAFNYFKNTAYGLQWFENFAAAHGKPSAYSEWGLNSTNGAVYVDLVKKWFDTHNVAYELYFDKGTFAITGGELGATSTAFQKDFSQIDPVATTTPPPTTDTTTTTPPPTTTTTAPPPQVVVLPVTITGTDGADTLTGNDLANVINGKAGADTIAGGKGDDTIAGGTGADSFRFAPGAGHDKVTDFAANGDADLIDISAYLKAGQKATLTNVGNDVSIGFANGDTILLTNIQSESLVATTTGYKMGLRFFSEAGGEQTNHAAPIGTHSYDKIGAAGDKDWFKLDLTKGADMRVAVEAAGSGMGTLEDAKVSIYDSTGKLIISDNDSGSAGDAFARFKAPTTGSYYVVVESAKAGGTGSYVLDVATSNMVFDTGTHQLNGSTGADILIGGAFNDSLKGGRGVDRFQFGLHSGDDVISDLASGELVDISAYKRAGYAATVTQSGSDTVIGFSTGDTIKLLGVAPGELVENGLGYMHR